MSVPLFWSTVFVVSLSSWLLIFSLQVSLRFSEPLVICIAVWVSSRQSTDTVMLVSTRVSPHVSYRDDWHLLFVLTVDSLKFLPVSSVRVGGVFQEVLSATSDERSWDESSFSRLRCPTSCLSSTLSVESKQHQLFCSRERKWVFLMILPEAWIMDHRSNCLTFLYIFSCLDFDCRLMHWLMKDGMMQSNNQFEQRIKSEPVTTLLQGYKKMSNMAMKSVEDVSHQMQHIYEDIDVKGPLNITPISGVLEPVKVSCLFFYFEESRFLKLAKSQMLFILQGSGDLTSSLICCFRVSSLISRLPDTLSFENIKRGINWIPSF